MKQVISAFLALMILLGFAACRTTGADVDDNTVDGTISDVQDTDETATKKTGTTDKTAAKNSTTAGTSETAKSNTQQAADTANNSSTSSKNSGSTSRSKNSTAVTTRAAKGLA